MAAGVDPMISLKKGGQKSTDSGGAREDCVKGAKARTDFGSRPAPFSVVSPPIEAPGHLANVLIGVVSENGK